MHSLRSLLEEKIQQKHLLAHSFYRRWQHGELSKDELQGYAKEYYRFENEFPRLLSSLHSLTEDAEVRQMILDNLIDEEKGSDNHPELWLRFAEGMGVTRDDVKSHFHSDETEHLVRTFKKHVTSGNPIDGLAALYAYERQQPDVARQKIDGLRCFYQVTDEDTVSFFKAHQTYDVFHAEGEVELLSKLCDTEEKQQRALAVAGETLDVLYDFLDGIERRYKVA